MIRCLLAYNTRAYARARGRQGVGDDDVLLSTASAIDIATAWH